MPSATTVRGDFDHVTLLADSLDIGRTPAAGFDGIAVYDNFVAPEHVRRAARPPPRGAGLVFSFNVNPGYDATSPRGRARQLLRPPPFAPPARRPRLDQCGRARARRAAGAAGASRSRSTRPLALQADPALANARRGFFLVYLNSFNEWHEGHQFEPALDAAELTPAQQALGYHNPPDGHARLRHLGTRLRDLLAAAEVQATRSAVAR